MNSLRFSILGGWGGGGLKRVQYIKTLETWLQFLIKWDNEFPSQTMKYFGYTNM